MTASGYPAWICSACGDAHGSVVARWSTWHPGTCGWCGERRSVTEPRDFGYPPAPPSSGGRPEAAPLPDFDASTGSAADVSASFSRSVETGVSCTPGARGTTPETASP